MMAPRILFAATAAALLWAPGGTLAQSSDATESEIVARVDGDDILLTDVLKLAAGLPPQYQAQLQQIYPFLVQRAVDFRLAGKAGLAEGLRDDAEVKARTAAAEERAIREVYLERKIAARVDDDAVRQEYGKFLADNPPKTEHRASHILLKTEAEARDAITRLDGGADFATLAEELSTGPSAERGGDLGYFSEDQMVPEFAAATAKLNPGEYSKDPTQTQFGWHVIKVQDRRETPQPTFAEVEEQLREELSREAVEAVLTDLRAGATIEILPAGETLPAPAGTPQ